MNGSAVVVIWNVDDQLRPRVGAADHVLLLAGLGVATEQDAEL
jgi:hypothetical protein